MCDCVDEECTELRMTDCLAFCNYFPQEGEVCDPTLGMAVMLEQCNAFDEDCDDLMGVDGKKQSAQNFFKRDIEM